jgi:hypothetical protein
MSVIAQKKAMQKRGKESILLITGILCVIMSILDAISIAIFSLDLSDRVLIPAIYFLVLGTLFIGTSTYIRENREKVNVILKDLLISLIIIGIIGGAVLGAYMY